MNQGVRHSAAVMFTDIVGYTAIMQADEELARVARDRHRRSLEPSVDGHGGKVLQYFGDGSLSVFPDPREAVAAAIEMQELLRADPAVDVRVGIHYGDVAYDEQGAYGDSVNVAARIESLSAGGGVLVSERLADEIRSSSGVQVTLVGDFELKNVKDPVRIYAVVGEGLRVPTAQDVMRRISGGVDPGAETFAADSGFEIQRLLGDGLLGRVYLARETRLGRSVVVKMMRPDLFADPEMRKRFEREARSIAKLSHPNLATLLRVGQAEERIPYLVMEYVKGVSLAAAIEADGPFPVDLARRILIQVGSALASAHDSGVVHRKVKPENVIWDVETERAVLTDFGFAKILDDSEDFHTRVTRTGQFLGDLGMASPEQLMGEPQTAATDMYGLGALGYRLLADQDPYQGETAAALALAQLQDPPIPLRDLVPQADPVLAELLERCLSNDPATRPTGREFVISLSRPGAAKDGAGPGSGPVEGGPNSGRGVLGMLARLLGRRGSN